MILKKILIGLTLLINLHQSVNSLACKDQYGRNTDFFFIEKAANNNNEYIHYYKSGLAVVSILKKDVDITDDSSIIGQIFEPLYVSPYTYNYIQYNDEKPDGSNELKLISNPLVKNHGHSRGVLIWSNTEEAGIWFESTVPKFLPPFILPGKSSFDAQFKANKYSFPKEYSNNAHSFMCIKIKHQDVVTVLKHIVMRNPLIYAHGSHNQDNLLNAALTVFNDRNLIRREDKKKSVIELESILRTYSGDSQFSIITSITKKKLNFIQKAMKPKDKKEKTKKYIFPFNRFAKGRSEDDLIVKSRLFYLGSFPIIF